ncbi:MAG: hypothetical protein M1330_04110 [Armatimonadetes bacterium]|nr:hypothetical protein [Armatimonadota bacterium]
MRIRLIIGIGILIVVLAIIYRVFYGIPFKIMADHHFDLSEYYAHQGDWPMAVKEMRKALKYDPHYVQARDGLAALYDENGLQTRAERVYLKGLALDPKSEFLHYQLASFYQLHKRYPEAIQQMLYCLKLKPNNIKDLLVLALLYDRNHQYPEAIQALKRRLTLVPNDYVSPHDIARIEREMRAPTARIPAIHPNPNSSAARLHPVSGHAATRDQLKQ